MEAQAAIHNDGHILLLPASGLPSEPKGQAVPSPMCVCAHCLVLCNDQVLLHQPRHPDPSLPSPVTPASSFRSSNNNLLHPPSTRLPLTAPCSLILLSPLPPAPALPSARPASCVSQPCSDVGGEGGGGMDDSQCYDAVPQHTATFTHRLRGQNERQPLPSPTPRQLASTPTPDNPLPPHPFAR